MCELFLFLVLIVDPSPIHVSRGQGHRAQYTYISPHSSHTNTLNIHFILVSSSSFSLSHYMHGPFFNGNVDFVNETRREDVSLSFLPWMETT